MPGGERIGSSPERGNDKTQEIRNRGMKTTAVLRSEKGGRIPESIDMEKVNWAHERARAIKRGEFTPTPEEKAEILKTLKEYKAYKENREASQTESQRTPSANPGSPKNIPRRDFVKGLVAGAGAMAVVGATGYGILGRENEGASGGGSNVSPEDLESGELSGEALTLNGVFEEMDRNNPAGIFQNPDTAGGHQSAVDYGHEHFVAYHEGLKDDIEFRDRYFEVTGSDFEGINTADEFFAYFKHIARTHTHVIASELIAMKYYDEETGTDFSNMSLRQAEDKILSGDFYDEERLKISEKIDKAYEEKTTFRFIDPPEGTVFKNMGTDVEEYDATRELHGVYVTTSAEDLVSDRIGKLLEVATTLPNGTVATRWVNTACSNLLNVIKYTRQDGSENVVVINPDTPTTPGSNNPDSPIPSDNPPGENPPGIDPKDSENMQRIDTQAHEDIAEDVGTGRVDVEQTESVSSSDLTEAPSSYQGTEATTTQSAPSQSAETVSPSSPENDYGQSQGGAHSSEYAPVQPNPEAQAQADAGEIPVSDAPTGGSEYDDILNDLGIN